MQAVTQVKVVDIEAQAPTFDVDQYRTGLPVKSPERAQAQCGVTQLLVNLSGSKGRHRCLRRDGGMARIGHSG
jgi:hypothetical protein